MHLIPTFLVLNLNKAFVPAIIITIITGLFKLELGRWHAMD